MRKFLIALIIILCIVLAAAISFLIYLERNAQDVTPTAASSTPATTDTTASTETVPAATTGIAQTFPTESPKEEVPGYTFSDADVGSATPTPPVESTERDPDDLETPGMKFD